jgi:hypothetical protein
MRTKTCSQCNVEKPINLFRQEKRTKDGYQARCKACEMKYKNEHKTLPESIDKRRKADAKRKLSYLDLYTSNPDLIDNEKYCPRCDQAKEAIHFSKELRRKGGLKDYCKVCEREMCKSRYDELKQLVFQKLGWSCCRCGYHDVRALQIDHVNGGGNKEHKQVKNSLSFLKKVLTDDKGSYQILCANCNWVKRHENKEEPFYTLKLTDSINGITTCR